jgi:hypothetical protein
MNLFTTWSVGCPPYIRFAFIGVLFFIASGLTSGEALAHHAKSRTGPPPPQGISFTVVVYDGTNNLPLELARVALYRGSSLVIGRVTNLEGRAILTDVTPGWYRLVVRSVGYNPVIDSIPIDASHTFDSVTLFEESQEVTVAGFREPAITTIDPATANQVFEAETYHAPPTARMTQLVQENLLGAVRAPTGEVHVRGQHGEFTYYVDGAPIPLGVFGGLNEVVDPKVIERATFVDGGWPAEWGGQLAAIVDIQNRVPTGALHLDFSSYAGSYLPNGNKDTIVIPNRFLNMNGQSLSLSDHTGKLGWFLSGSRQETDRRIDSPVPAIFHDHGFDYFLYGKADYLLSDKDYLTLNLNYGVTNTQVPFDSLELGSSAIGGAPAEQDDQQYTTNAFQTLSYFRTLSSEADHESNLMVAGYAREGSLKYTPGAVDVPAVEDTTGDTLHVFSTDRRFTTIGLRTKYDNRLSHEFMYAAGFNLSSTSGHEDFGPFDSARITNAPHSIADFTGYDAGVFVQSEIHPAEWTRFDIGVRYDVHTTPDTTETQFSPRFRWNFLIDENNSAYLYYGRLFMPNNIEELRVLSEESGSANTTPTVAERSNFYEAVYTHSFDFGLRSKLDYFRKDASPGVDDQTVGSSAVKTSVNIANVHTQGVELGLSYSSPITPFSGYVNTSIIHAYGSGLITGGFLPFNKAGNATDLDHDQRLSVVASVNYQPTNWFANITGIYGSGLTNGNSSGLPASTGLFDFNQYAHVTPSWIFNLSVGYTFHLTGGATIAPSLYVGNVLDHEHLLKGAYFSAASWEEPRNAILRVDVHL